MLKGLAKLGLACFVLSSCAVLHKVQLSDISDSLKGQAISVRVSETTVDFDEIKTIAKIASKNNDRLKDLDSAIGAYTALFQFGPRTGTPVFNDSYAHSIPERLQEKCPKGYLTNIISVREARSYPVVKGEIVRVDATCISKD